ncbi:DUF2851 family protein [Kaistella daneshvariae]|uniref:DUF2851 family protein n=1 Tax=Kaistella daneshvariae TaxID=2487074 RepID=A0ABM7CBA4_9FLAO|nr:DUF2851 family protein [Kaistella daneshvariae]AZI68294.1 DUF2851 family protein [Kaistella daneshvariae]
MNEKLLQYLWNFKIFNDFNFIDVDGNPLEILDFGKWNFNSGPDFLFGKIKQKNLVLAGNIELHVKSSDWIFHQHSGNPEFENIIAHVVYAHDVEIEEFKTKKIPTLELKNYIDENVIAKYQVLLQETNFIPCEKIFNPALVPFYFFDQNLLKKLDERSEEHTESLQLCKNNYEEILFQQLAYAFGLKVNAHIFKQIAESIDFSILNKIRQNQVQLEALFFGICGWLENPADEQMQIWKREFEFIQNKFSKKFVIITPKFSRLRPPNFPTLRSSQLAALYAQHQNLFSKLMEAKNTEQLRQIFSKVKASEYWDERFNFGKISAVKGEKLLTKDFIDLILINAVLPLKYTYLKNTDENAAQEILTFYENLLPEKNTVIEQWKNLGLEVKNALESQALLYHYHNYCIEKKCLQCSIGLKLMNIS